MNANLVQLFTGCNTFHFHCYFNENRLRSRKTNNGLSNSGEAGRSVVYFRKNENLLAKLKSLSRRVMELEVGKAD